MGDKKTQQLHTTKKLHSRTCKHRSTGEKAIVTGLAIAPLQGREQFRKYCPFLPVL